MLPGRAIHFLFRLDFEERGAAYYISLAESARASVHLEQVRRLYSAFHFVRLEGTIVIFQK